MPSSLGKPGRGAARPRSETRARTTVMMPPKMRQQVRLAMVEGGYGLRGKSVWISEAIQRFVELDEAHWIGLVLESDVGPAALSEREVLYLSLQEKQLLDRSSLRLRAAEPTADGPMSAIVRTAVTWRLLDEPLENLRVRQSNSAPSD